MSIKNLFGITPTALYGGRERIFHYGQVQAPAGPRRNSTRSRTGTKAGGCRESSRISPAPGLSIWRLTTPSYPPSAARVHGFWERSRSNPGFLWLDATA